MPRLDRYQDPAVYERLAGACVLGTLRGRARMRFARLVEERPYIQQAVEDWERRLNPLATRVAAVEPPARVWRAIRREIAREIGARRRKAATGLWSSVVLWRSVTAVAVVLLAATLIFQSLPAPTPAMPDYLAVLQSEDEVPMLVATARQESRVVHVMAMEQPKMAADEDWELWAVPKGGGTPVSLGVLSRGKETIMKLDPQRWKMVNQANAFAVSLEPRGGSLTGAPTGPVMYTGSCLEI